MCNRKALNEDSNRSQTMYGSVADDVRAAATRPYHTTLLCEPDFPFAQDGTRKDAHFRARQHFWWLTRASHLSRSRETFRCVNGLF